MKLFEKKLYNVLFLLEASVEKDIDKNEIEKLAMAHIENEKQIENLQKQIEDLLNKQNEIQSSNLKISEDIKKMIGTTKYQSLRFGKILVEFKITREKGVTKSAPQWKNIVYQLQKTYEIEEKVINKLANKFNNGNKTFLNINKELNITTESKKINESLGGFLKSLWFGFKSIWSMFYSSFKKRNDHLEKILQLIKQ